MLAGKQNEANRVAWIEKTLAKIPQGTRMSEANNVTIRRGQLGGIGGGLYTVKGETIFFLDTQAPSAESAAICAEAVSKVVDTGKAYIRPEVRQFIENHSKNS